ncbi:MAG: FkbM family methyltransferase [Ginsengibacter sp.]
MQINIFQYLGINVKNIIRQVVYELYRIYNKYLKNKFHVYDMQTIEIIRKLPADAVCIDIGVNEGQILNFLYKQCPKGKILAIEPIPDLIRYLRSKYDRKRVSVQQVALSDENDDGIFYYFPKRHSLSGLRARNIPEISGSLPREIIVPVRKLDDLFKEEKLDFIKIDVEGAEFNVLKGAQNILLKFKPIIIFESGFGGLDYYNRTPHELFDLLHALSYKIATLQNYLNGREDFSGEAFIINFSKGYDYQYIAYI